MTNTQVIILHPSKAETASGSSREFPDFMNFDYAIYYLRVTEYSGFTNVIIKVVEKDPLTGVWFDVITFTTITGITEERKILPTNERLGAIQRLSWSVSGTGSITFSVCAVAKTRG